MLFRLDCVSFAAAVLQILSPSAPGMHLLKHLICTSWGPLLHPVVMAAKGALQKPGEETRQVRESGGCRSTSSFLRPGGNHLAELASWERAVAAARSQRGHEGCRSLHGSSRDWKAWGDNGWAAPGAVPHGGVPVMTGAPYPALAAPPWSSRLLFMVSDSELPQLEEPVPMTPRQVDSGAGKGMAGPGEAAAWTQGGGQAGVRTALARMKMGSETCRQC